MNKQIRPALLGLALGLILLALLGAGCGQRAIVWDEIFPGEDVALGWAPQGSLAVYTRDNLFDLVDGQAEFFFAYAFEEVAVQRYANAEGNLFDIEVWRLATPADAYGLFTASISGDPLLLGNDGDIDLGRRVSFWQDHYYVQVRARQELSGCDPHVFAEMVAAALPQGGDRPELLQRLPQQGLVERSPTFFHEEITIQNYLWLGGENLLGLGPETAGFLAQYIDEQRTAQFLLVQYPDPQAAAAGLAALRADLERPPEERLTDGLVAAEGRDVLLGAVFGQIDETAAQDLLAEALGGP